ncbi:MAG: cyanophycinase [Candidatus Fluviicola riflensis]|nr:MAG: cyanophycinase [Candidatus Fluviicola riflensis]OGS75852.1 MAG: cyanophycinase [Candidatus Fluviicola riflensis]OGS83532.1 MAG: cyanophycinase [Fluviicola sp. RIFCSPHIGHO2_01_FULL_43_53]OGS85671.1 MAG: cyanophycinase [Fluviicola sp. RIFCSPHIGHO2_12_FULL_43_24]
MVPKGKLLLIGGAEDKGENKVPITVHHSQFVHLEILKKLVSEKSMDARIEVITTASSYPVEVRAIYEKAFSKVGYTNVGFMDIHSIPDSKNESYIERVEKADTVLFSGGDQFKITTIIGGSPVAEAIIKKYKNNAEFTVAGTSAGAMVMSKIMIQSGGKQEALIDADLKISTGLGLIKDCIIDTHFIRRGRFGRLVNAVVSNSGYLGIGLGEDTALLIRKGNRAQCLGSGMVVIIDGRYIEQTNMSLVGKGTPIYVDNLRVHLLVRNCEFNIDTCELSYSNIEIESDDE